MTSQEKLAPPVLDLAPFFENESPGYGVLERRTAVLEEIHNAAQEWGLFQVINHGLDSSLLKEALQNVKDFFALPLEEKLKLKTDHQSIGFAHDGGGKWYEVDGSFERKQRLAFATEDHPASVYNAWPETLTNFSLGLSKGVFKNAFNGEYYSFANYPAAMMDNQVPAFPSHQDATCFTMIAQLNQVEGYQIMKDGESEWLTVQPEKDALIVGIGDVLQVLSNGEYKSVVHRVVSNKTKERFSFQYFHFPGLEEEIAPLPQFTVEANEPPRYRPFKYEEFFWLKIHKNITTEHYAI